jgi:DNA-directed RNA polymerase specialized sigma24 family protein
MNSAPGMAKRAATLGAAAGASLGRRDRLRMTDPGAELDDETIASLIARSCAGEAAAWQALWAWLDPRLLALVRGFRMGRISQGEDEPRAVVLEVMARLREDDFRRLRLFVEGRKRDQRLGLLPWLKVVARRVAIDSMRAHPNYQAGRRGADDHGRWRDPKSLPPPSLLPGERPPVTRDGTAKQMLAHARTVLPEKHYQALTLKTQGEDAAEIARLLGFASAAEADRIVRAALERLRRKFRTSITGPLP